MGKQTVVGYQIEFAYKLTCIIIDLFISLLELIQFFQNNNRKINIILLKILQAIVVVKNNIRVEHKIFLCSHDS